MKEIIYIGGGAVILYILWNMMQTQPVAVVAIAPVATIPPPIVDPTPAPIVDINQLTHKFNQQNYGFSDTTTVTLPDTTGDYIPPTQQQSNDLNTVVLSNKKIFTPSFIY